MNKSSFSQRSWEAWDGGMKIVQIKLRERKTVCEELRLWALVWGKHMHGTLWICVVGGI